MMSGVVVVASHRRSGTHLVLDSLRANVPGVDPRFITLDRIEPSHPRHVSTVEFDRRLRSRRGIALVKTHALPEATAWRDPQARDYACRLLDSAPVIYVHRDGRDVLVSLYNYTRSYAPAIASLSFAEFIRSADTGPDAVGLTRAGYWQRHVLAWLARPPTALAAYEQLGTRFETALADIADRVGLPLNANVRPIPLGTEPDRLLPLRVALSKRLGLGLGRVSTAIRPRAGGSGGWRDSFDDADLAWFDGEAGTAMRALGYQ